jgi:two-component system, OmpR family, response regulator ResD
MDNIKVLMVDDESRMRKLVSDFLTRKGYIVIEAGDGEEALDRFYADKDISLVILDVMMPKMNGWDVCREIRKNSKVPIIMLTAKSDESSELNGFECGADEYIAKPFSPKILTARVDALIRRSYSIDSSEVTDVGGIIIDKAAHIVKIDGQEIDLSFKEFELLTYFVDNKGLALSREKILNITNIAIITITRIIFNTIALMKLFLYFAT